MRLPSLNSGQRLLAGGVAAGLIVLFCLGLTWRNPSVFWNDDYQVSILPVLADVARSWREGHWPLLSPYSWACGNLAGEYQYGTFSLFVNAAVVFVFAVWSDFAAQAAALSAIHLAALGSGAYLLARGRRLPAGLAVVVALIAALNGWEIGWGSTDWFGALAADAWLPWAWWAFERAMRTDGDGRMARLRWLLPAPFVYLVLTGGFPYTVVRLGLVTAWLGACALAGKRWQSLWPLVLGWIFGLMLSAPAWLSLLESIHGSVRAGGAGFGNFSWMVPATALPGLVLPNWTVTWPAFSARASPHNALELTGGLVPLAALLAAFVCRRGRAWRALRWDLALLGVTLALCMLPSLGMFRWSFRWLPLFHLVFALVGARSLRMLFARPRLGMVGNAGLWAAGLVGTTWLAMVVTGTANRDRITWYLPLWTLVVAVGWFTLAALLRRRGWALWVPAAATFALLWVAYGHQYTNPGLPKYAFGPGLAKVSPLSADRLYLSLYLEVDKNYSYQMTTPDFGVVLRPGSTGMLAGVHTVNGYSPIMPPGIGRVWDLETHGSISIDIARNLLTHEAGPDGLLARLGIDGLLVAHDFPVEDTGFPTTEWEPIFSSVEGTVYHRRGDPLPEAAAWTIDNRDGPQPGSTDLLRVIKNSRGGTVLDVTPPPDRHPTLVTFRRPYFPGYVADLDGKALPVVTSDESLTPAVLLPAGSHGRLTLRYRPRAVVLGGALAAVGLMAMGVFAADARRRRVRAGRTGAALP